MATSVLYNGDCSLEMNKIADRSVELILTDPPYNLGNFMINRSTNLSKMRDNFFANAGWDNLEFDDWVNHMDNFFADAARIIAVGGSMIVFMSIIKVETIIKLAEKHGFYYKTTGIWHKLNPMPRNMNLHFVNSTEAWVYFTYKKKTGTFNNENKMIHDFIETAVVSNGEKKAGKHPTQKPVALLNHFITLLSNEGDLVVDPFMGSGSTGVACKQRNRNFIGIELDKDFTSTFDKTKTITGTAPVGSVVSIFVYEKLPDNKQELILIDSYTITVGLTGYFTKTIDLVVGENIINIDFSKDKLTSSYSTTINRKKSEIKNELQQVTAINRAIR